ncbi:MAG: DUF1761 domain-containing protein [Candidatus Micrarchaeota archaeon]
MINAISVIIGTVVSIVIGMIWYSPSVFGKQWMKELKMKESEVKKSDTGKTYFLMTVMSVVQTFVLAIVLEQFRITGALYGALIGVLLWAGFIATTNFSSVLFEKRSSMTYTIFSVYQLVAMIAIGASIVLSNRFF